MGVHDSSKYPWIKEALGIPRDEPIFILRAQDDAAMLTMPRYAEAAHDAGASIQFIRDIGDVSMAFAAWRTDNRDRCGTPD